MTLAAFRAMVNVEKVFKWKWSKEYKIGEILEDIEFLNFGSCSGRELWERDKQDFKRKYPFCRNY